MKKEDFDFDLFEQESLEKLKEGKPVFGKEGVFTPLLKRFLEKALESELEVHLNEAKEQGNKRNGKTTKTMKFTHGEFPLETPRDRQGSFQPSIVEKRQTFLGDDLENKIISMYGKGMSYAQIVEHMSDIYGLRLSKAKISEITDKIIPEMEEWQNQPLERIYPVVWFDAIHYKVRHNSTVESRAIYNILAVNTKGKKELLGLYVSEQESAKFWLQVLEDLQARGVKDILIACTDNLSGFSDAISSIFPQTAVQSCIIHQIRNSLKYVVRKDKTSFINDMRAIYKAPNLETAEINLTKFEEIWKKRYPAAVKSWRVNWYKLSTFFDYGKDIRRIMYTTNAIEAVHRRMRKVTKTKGAFSSDVALKKLIYLAIKDISRSWTGVIPNWGLVLSQLMIKFEDRINSEL